METEEDVEGEKKDEDKHPQLKELDEILLEINNLYEPIKKRLDAKLKVMEKAKKLAVASARGKRARDGVEDTLSGEVSAEESTPDFDAVCSVIKRLDLWLDENEAVPYWGSRLRHLPLSTEKHEEYRRQTSDKIDLVLAATTHNASTETDTIAILLVCHLMRIDRDGRRLTLALQMLGQPKNFRSSARLVAAELLNRCRLSFLRLDTLLESELNTYCVALEHLETTVAPILRNRNGKCHPLDEADQWYPVVVPLCLGALKAQRSLTATPASKLIVDKAVKLVVKCLPYIKHDVHAAFDFVSALENGILGPVEPLQAQLEVILETEVNMLCEDSMPDPFILACAGLVAFGDQPVRLLESFSAPQLRMGKHLDSQLATTASGGYGLSREEVNLAIGLVMPLAASQRDWIPTMTWRAAVPDSTWRLHDCTAIFQHLVQTPTHPIWACQAFYDKKGSPAMSNKEEVMRCLEELVKKKR